MIELSDIEKIEAKYPQLRFWGVEVPNIHYHASIEGNDVYVNMLQPDTSKLKSMLHETVHCDYDSGDLSNVNSLKAMHAEGWAERESQRRFEEMFGNHNFSN